MPDTVLELFPILAVTVPRSEVVGLCATVDALEAYRAWSPECSPDDAPEATAEATGQS